jgi:quercetin 2,3-dioxygenase
MIVRKSEERRHVGNKGEKNWMTFDWENKADPLQDGFGVLKILNEEILSPGSGFILYTHEDMVVVTYVHEGLIIYKDPLEEPDFMEAKDFHRAHVTPETKQYAINVSQSEDANIFQCGFTLSNCGSTPSGGFLKRTGMKKLFTHAERQGTLKLVASSDGRQASLSIQQDVYMYSTLMHKGNHIVHELRPGRNAWLHVVKGHILMGHLDLQTGDGVGLSDEISVSFTAESPTEILLFDLCGEISEKIKTASKSRPQLAEIR